MVSNSIGGGSITEKKPATAKVTVNIDRRVYEFVTTKLLHEPGLNYDDIHDFFNDAVSKLVDDLRPYLNSQDAVNIRAFRQELRRTKTEADMLANDTWVNLKCDVLQTLTVSRDWDWVEDALSDIKDTLDKLDPKLRQLLSHKLNSHTGYNAMLKTWQYDIPQDNPEQWGRVQKITERINGY